jgi:hypothetical protein
MPDDETRSDQVSDDPTPKDDASQSDDDAFDKDRALATINKLRGFEKLSKQQARELDDLRARVKAADDAKLSETEKLTQRLTDLERGQQTAQQALQDERLRNAVLVTAQKLGAVDSDAVYRLLDRDGLEFDSQGRPQNVETAVKALLKERPYLSRGNGSADGGAGHHGRDSSGLDMNTQIRRLAGRV